MKLIDKILTEAIITPPNIPNTMSFWHGGNLDEYDDNIAQKNGRYEYGPGLYLTTKFDVASKYRKGSRKLYLITVEKGVDINDAKIPYSSALAFVKQYATASLRKSIIERFQKYISNGEINAYLVNNILLNEKAIKPSNTIHLRQFWIDNGIDYDFVGNYGGGEMLVLFNMKKIVNVIKVNPKDEIKDYDLHN